MQIKVNNVNLDIALRILFKELNIYFVLKEKSIILSRGVKEQREGSILWLDSIPTELITVRGRVVNSSNVPMPGVTVFSKQIRISTVTDNLGNFILVNISSRATISFSYVGYETISKRATSDFSEVIMSPKVTELKNVEIVSTGYQELVREKVTGSVVKIGNELFNRQVGSNVLDRIFNVTSGLLTDPLSNGSKKSFFIRG